MTAFLTPSGISGYSSALGSLCVCVCLICVWTGRILPRRPKLFKISVHGLHMICSKRLSEKILQKRLHSGEKSLQTFCMYVATMKPYLGFNTEALVWGKPYICNGVEHVALGYKVQYAFRVCIHVRTYGRDRSQGCLWAQDYSNKAEGWIWGWSISATC